MSGTAIIIQARLGSSRLPAKVLLPLHNDNSVLTEVIYRCLSIKDIDFVIVAAPERDVEIISDHLCGFGHEIVGGPEHNVLARYYKAACRVNADTIMRITADCPMIDPNVCAGVLAMHKGMGVHYTSNIWPQRLYPPGYDCEVFSMEALARAAPDYEVERLRRPNGSDGMPTGYVRAVQRPPASRSSNSVNQFWMRMNRESPGSNGEFAIMTKPRPSGVTS